MAGRRCTVKCLGSGQWPQLKGSFLAARRQFSLHCRYLWCRQGTLWLVPLIFYPKILEIQFGQMLSPTCIEGALRISSLPSYISLIFLSLMTKGKFGLLTSNQIFLILDLTWEQLSAKLVRKWAKVWLVRSEPLKDVTAAAVRQAGFVCADHGRASFSSLLSV